MTEQERPTNTGPLLIFGLRNPTARYANTRHNAGAMAVQRLAKRHDIEFQQRSNGTVVGRGDLWGRDVRLILPGTYMNVSGDVVGPLVRRFGRRLDGILIVIDEMDLPLGIVRLRPYGSAGGHNGMKSIISALGTQEFPRLRIGVGRPENGGIDPIQHVLARFRPDEQKLLDAGLDRAADCMELLIQSGINEAMNEFNGRQDE